MNDYIIAMDIGSSSIKACAFSREDEIKLLYSNTVNIGMYSPMPGYEENDPEEVWDGVCTAINRIVSNCGLKREDIRLISICSQAQSVVLVDKDGEALTPIYNSQDARATDTYRKYYSHGIKVDGINVFKVAKCYLFSGFMPGSAKDPVFKYKWAEDNLPEIYEKTHKWLDVKDYIICRMTGEFTTTKDNAHAYTIYNSRENKGKWSKGISRLFAIDMDKLPRILDSTDIVGRLTKEAAGKTGLTEDTLVIGGVIDSTGVQYGSGAVEIGEEMVYWGTSGWVGTVTDKLKIDVESKMGALVTALDNKYHYYANLDSAGVSYQWLKEHIIEDDGVLNADGDSDKADAAIYDRMNNAIRSVPAGSNGLLYAPWITGCRAPMEASDIGGMFVNIKRDMDKRFFVRAVVEGICYHYRLLQEVGEKKVGSSKVVRFVGGGAKSDEVAQILADIMGCTVEIPAHPQDAGALGAAIVGFSVLDENGTDIIEIAHRQKAEKTFTPNKKNHKLYSKYYEVYKQLYKRNKNILSKLTEINEKDYNK